MKKWLVPLIKEEHFFDQFAFISLPGRGCSSALSTIYSHCISIVDENLYGNILFIDFSKAFDRASTFSILNSLIALHAPLQCIYWIYSFLQDRSIQVSYNGEDSKFVTISGGTPQGSIISPVLFAVLCHTLQPLSKSCKYFKYADDLTVIQKFSFPSNSTGVLQNEADHILSWCARNGMLINEQKTKLMQISGNKSKVPHCLLINGITIESIATVKFLGLLISDNLKWNEHVTSAVLQSF